MSKDDYHVIVYQILAYLYQCLKKEIAVEKERLMHDGGLFSINPLYWKYIIMNVVKEGLIDGVVLTQAWGEKFPLVGGLEQAIITPKGIEYLTDNSFLQKAKEFLKDTKSIVPFI